LTEIRELLILDEEINCGDAKAMAEQKLSLVQSKINELSDIKID
jgi:hypothetical protein